jgi:hypothetical protein
MTNKSLSRLYETFDPTNDDGSIIDGLQVRTDRDFELFTKWMSSSNEQVVRRRQKGYSYLAKRYPDDPALQKAEFIASVCGQFLRDKLKVAASLSASSKDDKERDNEETFRCRSDLAWFFIAVSNEFCERQLLISRHLSQSSLDLIVREFFKDGQSISGSILNVAKGLGKMQVVDVIEWIENANPKEFRKRKSPLSEEEKRLLGMIAPLVDSIIGASVTPSERAGRIAILLAYAKSGWMESDLRGEDVHPDDLADKSRLDHLSEWREAVGEPLETALIRNMSQRLMQAVIFKARVTDLKIKAAPSKSA